MATEGLSIEILVVCSDLRINLEQVVILGVSSEEISDADDSTAERPPVLHAAQILLLARSHPPCTHTASTVITALLRP